MSVIAQQETEPWRLTFQKLLACVLLEEGFMLDRFVKIVDHELEDRFDFIFGVSRVVSKSCILKQSTSSDPYRGSSSNYHTHSPRSSIIRERNIDAAAM